MADELDDLRTLIAQMIDDAPPGQKISIRFSGKPMPIEVEFCFKGGWKIPYVLSPGDNLDFVRGEDGYLDTINISFLEYGGPRQV